MGEIQRTKINSIYADFKGIQKSESFDDKSGLIRYELIDSYNKKIDELSDLSNTDYSEYKVPESSRYYEIYDEDGNKRITDEYHSDMAKCNLERIISRLEVEYGFGEINQAQKNQPIVIVNKNEQNQTSININYTINDLIEKTNDEEGKKKLNELKDELNKPSKNWEKIKNVLIWIINFSKDLFLEVLPIILENYKTN